MRALASQTMGNVCPAFAALFGRRKQSLPDVDPDPLLELRPPLYEDATAGGKTLADAGEIAPVVLRTGAWRDPAPLAKSAQHAPSMQFARFVREAMPTLTGHIAIVTGASSGTGFWCALALAARGATVVLACRNLAKADAAKERMDKLCAAFGLSTEGQVVVSHLDLASFASVRSFAADFRLRYAHLNHLVLNAGTIHAAKTLTADGWDVQLQTNHLSHFLLTQQLFEQLSRAPSGARVVSHSSRAHSLGTPRIAADLNAGALDGVCGLAGMIAPGGLVRYSQSKLANVLFCFELDRRLRAAGLGERVRSVAAHPGFAATGLFGAEHGWLACISSRFAQPPEDGALPLLFAATRPDAKGGGFYGPSDAPGGLPVACEASGHAHDLEMARELWSISESACGCRFDVAPEN